MSEHGSDIFLLNGNEKKTVCLRDNDSDQNRWIDFEVILKFGAKAQNLSQAR